jgi:hypothetical protein
MFVDVIVAYTSMRKYWDQIMINILVTSICFLSFSTIYTQILQKMYRAFHLYCKFVLFEQINISLQFGFNIDPLTFQTNQTIQIFGNMPTLCKQ